MYWIHNGKGNKEAGIVCSETRIPKGKFKILSWNDTIKKMIQVMLDIELYVLSLWVSGARQYTKIYFW